MSGRYELYDFRREYWVGVWFMSCKLEAHSLGLYEKAWAVAAVTGWNSVDNMTLPFLKVDLCLEHWQMGCLLATKRRGVF